MSRQHAVQHQLFAPVRLSEVKRQAEGLSGNGRVGSVVVVGEASNRFRLESAEGSDVLAEFHPGSQTGAKLRAISSAAKVLTSRSAAVDASSRSITDPSSLAGIAQFNASSGSLVRVRLTAHPGLTDT
jgi:hypothetical protein